MTGWPPSAAMSSRDSKCSILPPLASPFHLFLSSSWSLDRSLISSSWDPYFHSSLYPLGPQTLIVQCKNRLSGEAGSCPWDLHSEGKESPTLRNLGLKVPRPSPFLPNPERKSCMRRVSQRSGSSSKGWGLLGAIEDGHMRGAAVWTEARL